MDMETPLSQPRTLENFEHTKESSPRLDSSILKFEIGKLINEARYGGGREVATAGGILSEDDPLVHPAPQGSLFSAENLLPPDEKQQLDGSIIINIQDIPEQTGEEMVEIKTKDIVPFVLLAKRAQDPKWTLTPLDFYDDFMNLFQCFLLEQDVEIFQALEWCNKRGNVGLFGVQSNDLNILNNLRNFITTKSMAGWIFNSYPHALAAKRYELTALLKSNLRTLDLKIVPKMVFLLNKKLMLKGSLECVKYKEFKAGEVSKQGESKTHWRLVVLSADEAFMTSIKPFPQSQPFKLGTGTVQIRGGERKHEERKKSTFGTPTTNNNNNQFYRHPPGRRPAPPRDHSFSGPRSPPPTRRPDRPQSGRDRDQSASRATSSQRRPRDFSPRDTKAGIESPDEDMDTRTWRA